MAGVERPLDPATLARIARAQRLINERVAGVSRAATEKIDSVRKDIPPFIRAFVSSLAGDRSPYSENDLSPEDMERLQNLIRNAENNRRQNPNRDGGIQYEDYRRYYLRPAGENASSRSNEERFAEARAGQLSSGGSGLNQFPERIKDFLGRANYRKNEDGSYQITDNYDFNNKVYNDAIPRDQPLVKSILQNPAILADPAGIAGAVFLRDIDRPISIRVPPKKSARGG